MYKNIQPFQILYTKNLKKKKKKLRITKTILLFVFCFICSFMLLVFYSSHQNQIKVNVKHNSNTVLINHHPLHVFMSIC